MNITQHVFADNPQVVPLLREAAEYYRWKARANPHMLTYDYSSEDDPHHQRFLDLYMALYVARPQQLSGSKAELRSKHGEELESIWQDNFGYGLECCTQLSQCPSA